MYTELGDERGVAIMITRLAIHAAQVGDVSRARSLAERALALADELELPWLEAQALSALATAYRTEKNPVAAYELTEKSAKLAAESGFRWWESAELLELTELGLELGELDKAERAGREGVRLAVAIEDRLHVVWGLMLLAQLAREKDELELAGRIWGAIDAEKEAFVAPGLIPMLIEAAGPLLSETHPRFETGCRLGRSEGIEAALELALGPDQTVP